MALSERATAILTADRVVSWPHHDPLWRVVGWVVPNNVGGLSEGCDAIQEIPKEIKRLRAALVKFVEHFGPLEDNHMVNEDARACFKLAREALGPDEHIAAIRRAFSG